MPRTVHLQIRNQRLLFSTDSTLIGLILNTPDGHNHKANKKARKDAIKNIVPHISKVFHTESRSLRNSTRVHSKRSPCKPWEDVEEAVGKREEETCEDMDALFKHILTVSTPELLGPTASNLLPSVTIS